jgi:formylmethanofuran dehydrogenase subunit C
MAALTLTAKEAPPVRVDLSPLTPDRLAGLKAREIAALRLVAGRDGFAVGDLFSVRGSDAETVVIDGGSPLLDAVGADMAGGTLRVVGDVGDRAGAGMRGGLLVVEGSAGPRLGAGLVDGRVDVAGDAGERAGGALPGRMTGMAGGIVTIAGTAGPRAGDRMRRGLLVAGACAEEAGSRMIAGTILAGRFGPDAGVLMKRGTLIAEALDGPPPPTFLSCGTHDLQVMAMLAAWIASLGLASPPAVPRRVTRLQGDMAALGKGEILLAA